MRLATLLLTASALALGAEAAFAQAVDDDVQPATERIVVTGTRASLDEALGIKRDATGFVDAIAAEDTAQFPDLNLAEALQRVPGVTVNRSLGEGSQIVLRGFTPEFSRIEINGMSATPTSLGREFNFAIFASELFTRAEVRKTGSAEQTEGGLAGTVALFTPKPLDSDPGLTLAAAAQANYAEQSESTDPQASLVIGQNWDDTFGAIATFAFSKQSFLSQWADTSNWDRARDAINNNAEAGVSADVLDAWLARAPRILHFDRGRERFGATLDLQYRPFESGLLTWSTLYGKTDRSGLELRTDFAELEGGLGAPRDVVLDNVVDGRGRIVSGVFPAANARTYTTRNSDEETFLQSVLHGEFALSEDWSASGQVGLTEAEGVFFDRAYSFGIIGEGAVSVRGDFVDVVIPGVSITDPADFPDFRYADYRIRTKQDDEFAAQFDLARKLDAGPLSEISFGARYADHTATVDEDKWSITNASPVFDPSALGSNGRAVGLSAAPAELVTLVPFSVPGQPGGFATSIMQVDFAAADDFYGIADLQTEKRPLDSFAVTEEITAAYLKADFQTDIAGAAVIANVGVRWVETALTSSGARQINGVVAPITVERSYDEILPSGSVRVGFTDDLILRAAAGRSLNRPKLADLSPRSTLDVGRNTGTSGNPDLDPFTANYFDVGLEWYFLDEGLLSAAYFRKDIDSLVETLTEDVTLVVPGTLGGPAVPTEFQLTRPINGDEARVQGFEFIAQTPFTFLPAPFDRFGGLFNYTYTESEANFTDAGDVSSVQLPGLSKNSFNAVAYYQHGPADVRLAYAWRDEFVDNPFGPGGNPIWQDGFGQLDLSASFEITDQLTLQFEGLNLTEEGEYLYTAGRKDLPVRRASNERRMAVGLRFRL